MTKSLEKKLVVDAHVRFVVLNMWPGRNETFSLLNSSPVEAHSLKRGLIAKSGYPCHVNRTASSREPPASLETLPDCQLKH